MLQEAIARPEPAVVLLALAVLIKLLPGNHLVQVASPENITRAPDQRGRLPVLIVRPDIIVMPAAVRQHKIFAVPEHILVPVALAVRVARRDTMAQQVG